MNGIEQGTNGDTFWEVMGPKLQQKKLWDQIETFVKVMGPKVHLSHDKNKTSTWYESPKKSKRNQKSSGQNFNLVPIFS